MSNTISNADDLIDLRDVIARVEDLEDNDAPVDSDERAELGTLMNLLQECMGNGGDEQWRGDWYPVSLIRDSYFKDYARDLAADTGAIPDDVQWPCSCIDWDQAARELQMDYTAVDFDGVTYWIR